MSEEITPESKATPDDKSVVGDGKEKIVVNRSAEEYATRVQELSAENKRRKESERALKTQLDEISAQLKASQEKEMNEQGKFKDAYEKTKAELEDERKGRQKDKSTFAYRTVSQQLAAEATKLGCLNAQALVKIATADGLIDELEISQDTFEIDSNSMKSVLERAQKENPFLFGKPTPKLADGTPGVNRSNGGTPDLSKLSMDQLVELAQKTN